MFTHKGGLLAFLYCQKTPAPEEAKKEWGVLGSRPSSQSLEAVQGAANKERGCPESQSWTQSRWVSACWDSRVDSRAQRLGWGRPVG